MAGDLSQVPTVQQSIPIVQQIISFYLSLAIAALSLFFLSRSFILQAKLKFFVTKYFFIRVAPFGEALYAHTVSMTLNDNALIKNAYAELVKTSGAVKKYNLETQMVCKVASEGLVGDYNILSSSPLEIFEKEKSNSRVYVFVINEYKEKIKEISSSLENYILNQKRLMATTNPSEDKKKEMFHDLIRFQIESTNQIYDCLQIEEGEYELTMYIEYEKKIACLNCKWTSKAKSKLKFNVDSSYKKSMRDKILKYMQDASIQLIGNSQVTTPLPHYIPYDITEKIDL